MIVTILHILSNQSEQIECNLSSRPDSGRTAFEGFSKTAFEVRSKDSPAASLLLAAAILPFV